VLLALWLAFASAPPAEVQGRAQQILEKGYQTELPAGGDEAAAGGGDGKLEPGQRRRRRDGRWLDHREGDDIRGEEPTSGCGCRPGAGAGGIGNLLLLVIGGGALLLLLSWLANELLGRRGGGSDVIVPGALADGDADAALTEKPLDDADELAKKGRYGEAIRVLLLRTLAELARRVAVPASLTSREVLAQAPVPDRARDALRSLVVAVEISHFGGAVPGADDYRACAERFRAFVDAYRAVPAAA
jgi:hypothetical protein